jgi:hypothetical protein
MIAISALIKIRDAGYKVPEILPATVPDEAAEAEPI